MGGAVRAAARVKRRSGGLCAGWAGRKNKDAGRCAERAEEARHAWREAVAALDAQQFVFLEERGTTSSLTRL